MNKNNTFKVLQICSYYVGSSLYKNLFNALEEQGLIEDIYVFTHKGDLETQAHATNVYLSRCFNLWERYIFRLKHKRVFNNIESELNLAQYSVSHAHSLFSNGYIAYQLKKRLGIPYVVAVRNTDVNLFFKKMIHLRPIGVRIMANSEKIVFISKPYQNQAVNRFIPPKYKEDITQKSVVIPNGIDIFWHKNRIQKKSTPGFNAIKLVYVGDISPNKNIETTIEACTILLNEGIDINFTVVGELKDIKYEKFISQYPFVEHLPYCKKEELIKHYRRADIFVMPSKHETFGLVYAEAMTQGLPLIYTRGQGFDGQFKEGEVGYSVHHDSPREIAQRIKDILDDYNLISSTVLDKSKKFTWDLIANKYLNIYKQIINVGQQ